MTSDEFIIVDEPDDTFSAALGVYASGRAVTWRRIRLGEFARTLTVEHENARAKVWPETPLLLRPLRGAGTADEETRFCWNEQFSTLWSAAALTSKPVINRPNECGWGGRITFSSALTEQRCHGAVAAPESYWHGLPPPADGMFHQDLTTWTTVESPGEDAYVRSRLLPRCRGWDQVIVVGKSAFRVTAADLGSWAIEEESLTVAASLRLEFATVSWAIPEEGTRGVLARVNPFPALAEVMPVWNEVSSTLLSVLLS